MSSNPQNRSTQLQLIRMARALSGVHLEFTSCYALCLWASITGFVINWFSGWTIGSLLLYGYGLFLAAVPFVLSDQRAVFRRRILPATHGFICGALVAVSGGYQSPFLFWLLIVPFIATVCDDAWATTFWTMIAAMYLSLVLFTDPLLWRSGMPTSQQLVQLHWIGPLCGLSLIVVVAFLSAVHILHRDRQLERLDQETQSEIASKRDFLSKMSHELRTPLTAILGFAEELAVRLSDNNSLRAADAIQRNSRAMLTSLEDLMEWGRIECGAVPLQQALHALPRLFNESQAALASLPAPQVTNVSLAYDGTIPSHLMTDRLLLQKAIVKCAAAALQATGRGGIQLTVRTNVPQQRLEIDIGPLGDKWEMDDLQKLTDQSSSPPSVAGGFSLAMARGLAQLLGGEVQIAQLSKTAALRLLLPTGPLEKSHMITPTPSGPAPGNASGSRNRAPRLDDCRILLVEDSPDTKALITFLLNRAGADIQAVENGQAAIAAALAAQAQGKSFDIILMDMQMPIMDGREATERLRKEGYDRPIIAFTAQAVEFTRDKCLCAGCNDYITKPFRSHELIELVARYARNNLEAVMSG